MHDKLRPTLSMSDIYGPGHIFASRAHNDFCQWLPNELHQLDAFTGGQLAIAGEMTILCSRGFTSPAAEDFLASAGIELACNRIAFAKGEDLAALSRAIERPGVRLVLQHALPDAMVPPERCWIDPALLRYLNNKANLADLVKAEHVPRRQVVDRERFFASSEPMLPLVIKAVSEQSSGGGCAVAICRRAADLKNAERLFAKCETVVVEEFLEIERNPCLNFAVMPDGEVRYFGFADQDLTPDGKYLGNWLDSESSIPDVAIEAALEPVRRGAALGYRGIAGVDVAFTAGGQVNVLDLNFRANGCTTPLLLAPAVKERSGFSRMHFRKLHGGSDAEQLAALLAPWVERGRLVPLNLFNPVLAGHRGKPSSAQAMVLGASREEILATEAELAAAGVS